MQLGLKSELKTVLKLVMEKRKIVKIRVSNRRGKHKMKQFLAFIAAGILALIALGSLAGIVGFAIGAGVVYWSYKSFVRAQSFLES